MFSVIWYHLYNFKNVKSKHGGVVLLVKTLPKVTLLHGYFSRFLNCANVTKSRNALQIKTRKIVQRNRTILLFYKINTAQKMKFSIQEVVSKWDQIHSFLQVWSHLLMKYFMENFIFCKVLEMKNCLLYSRKLHMADIKPQIICDRGPSVPF